MELISVDSSNVLAVGYDSAASELTVVFRSEGAPMYVYSNVSEAEYKDLLDADSKGKWLARHVKGIKAYVRTR